MTDFWSFFEGFIIMVVGICLSAVLVLCAGMFLDNFLVGLTGAGLDAGAGTVWDTTGNVNILINLFYFACCMPAIFGVAAYFLITAKRSKLDAYGSAMYSDDESW